MITRLAAIGVVLATGLGATLRGPQSPAPMGPAVSPAPLRPIAVATHPTAGPAALAFRGVTVVDVQTGHLRPDQTVVITGTRITAVGPTRRVRIPAGARAVDARGKYLIPGLWDMHAHPIDQMAFAYPLYLANGVTGIRNASTWVSIDTMRRWQREILAGTRAGPPRQLVTGRSLDRGTVEMDADPTVDPPDSPNRHVSSPAAARRLVDSLQAAGADFIKVHDLSRELFFAIAAEARRRGILFSGHLADSVTVTEASDSGQHGLDHMYSLPPECVEAQASVERCRPVIAHLRHNDTWLIPTAEVGMAHLFGAHLRARLRYLPAALSRQHWPNDSGSESPAGFLENLARPRQPSIEAAPVRALDILQRAGGATLLLAGTDVGAGMGMVFPLMPGFSLHDQLASLVAAGLSPLGALQAATLHPAQFIDATDSLGTVAVGKLADLVLLDANPLVDIHNTTKIRAVVANGRYFDRGALDTLLQALEQVGDPRWR